MKPGTFPDGLSQHIVRNVERDDVLGPESTSEYVVCAARRRAEVENIFRLDQDRFEPRKQALTRHRMHEVGRIETLCRSVEAASKVS